MISLKQRCKLVMSGEFALAEGKKGGQFYTLRSVVELLVGMLELFKVRVFDPCCVSIALKYGGIMRVPFSMMHIKI